MKIIVTAAMAGLLLSACSSQAPSPNGNSPEQAANGMSHSGMSASIDPANPDRSFAEMMIPHHRGAVEMAEAELRFGKDPELRALATKIIADQQREIEQLERWLAKPSPAARDQ